MLAGGNGEGGGKAVVPPLEPAGGAGDGGEEKSEEPLSRVHSSKPRPLLVASLDHVIAEPSVVKSPGPFVIRLVPLYLTPLMVR